MPCPSYSVSGTGTYTTPPRNSQEKASKECTADAATPLVRGLALKEAKGKCTAPCGKVVSVTNIVIDNFTVSEATQENDQPRAQGSFNWSATVQCGKRWGFVRYNDAASGGDCQISSNCYNYATDLPRDDHPKEATTPGRHGKMMATMPYTCDAVKKAAEKDGLDMGVDSKTDITLDTPIPEGCWRVALIIKTDSGTPAKPKGDSDFHWLRQEDDGSWTHKQGQCPATDLDEDNNKITDPKTAKFGGYTFCAYGIVCPNKVTEVASLAPRGVEAPWAMATLSSGGPNPIVSLSVYDLAEIIRAFSDLQPVEEMPSDSKKLGGYLIYGIGSTGRSPSYIRVHDDYVYLWDGMVLDAFRSTERFDRQLRALFSGNASEPQDKRQNG